MMRLLLKIVLKFLPWLLLIAILVFFISKIPGWPFSGKEEPETAVTHTTILNKIEALGKLELVKYNFQEVTELTEKNSNFLGIFPSGDSRAVLISQGEAVGCIDLTKIRQDDIVIMGDSIFITMPEPEICYHKLNMEKTRIYSIEKGVYYKDEKKMIEKAYRLAERQIRQAALESGILEQTRENSELILLPLMEELSDKKVFFRRPLDRENINRL